jgi:hypothetical protein
MFNPLLGSLANIKDADLESKIADLTKKYFIAARMGQGSVCGQIASLIDSYKYELQTRQAKAALTLVKKQDKDLDDLINVG